MSHFLMSFSFVLVSCRSDACLTSGDHACLLLQQFLGDLSSCRRQFHLASSDVSLCINLQGSVIQSAVTAGAPTVATPANANMDVAAVGGRRLLKGYAMSR